MTTSVKPGAGWAEEWLAQLDWTEFLRRHHLEKSYLEQASVRYAELVEAIRRTHKQLGRPIVVGVNGAQGSGKSTLADWLVHAFSGSGNSAVALSIDDFYLTHQARLELAELIHPLLKTRGVPGTHDIELALRTLGALTNDPEQVRVPRFDKAHDDRQPASKWPLVKTPTDVIVLEGWCLGIGPQSADALTKPVNELERREDAELIWRQYVNRQLQKHYPPLFDQVDIWVMLRAPGFATVYDWRLEQEHKLAASLANNGAAGRVMSDTEIHRFIQHYQRLTEHGLETLPSQVNFLFTLDSQRQIVNATRPVSVDS